MARRSKPPGPTPATDAIAMANLCEDKAAAKNAILWEVSPPSSRVWLVACHSGTKSGLLERIRYPRKRDKSAHTVWPTRCTPSHRLAATRNSHQRLTVGQMFSRVRQCDPSGCNAIEERPYNLERPNSERIRNHCRVHQEISVLVLHRPRSSMRGQRAV